MKTPVDYKPFEHPKIGLFNIHTDEYGEGGWIDMPQTRKIIGETPLQYVYELKKLFYDKWEGDKKSTVHAVIPMGIHKSRLIQWQQLELF